MPQHTEKTTNSASAYSIFRAFALWVFALVLAISSATQTAIASSPVPPTQEYKAREYKDFVDSISIQPTPAPNITMIDMLGKEFKLQDYKGKVVVLNLWAMWCGVCKKEMPGLSQLQKDYEEQGIEVLPLSTDDVSVEEVLNFYKSKAIDNLPVVLDKNMVSLRIFKIRALPSFVIIDRAGMMRAQFTSFANFQSPELTAYIEGLLNESTHRGYRI